jgi:hypothetical protein
VVTARGILAASATAVGPFFLAAAITVVAMACPVPAAADTGSTVLSNFGIGNNGPVSSAIAQFATGLCPLLVKPGATAAKNAVSGQGQLASQIAGGVAELAIKSQCPAFMTSLANGDLSVLSNAASIFGLSTSTTTSNPLAIPGI